ncbi:MAG: LamG domain-containing protein [Candidatus Aenigmarchaeota archaeon]|nr:LamG domain-containing protein [Candidatus Aenigmarchaeota archaeon]
MAKGQVFSLDFIFSVTVFFSAIIIILFVLTNASQQAYERIELNDMELRATKTADLLVRFKGNPENWTSANVKSIGLAEQENILSQAKISNFLMLNYNTTKSILAVGNNEFFFTLLDSESLPLIHLPANLSTIAAGWNFEESGGDTAYDISPNSNNGALNCTAPCSPPQRVKGYAFNGIEFDGADDYISVNDSPTLSPDHLSIELWMKVRKYPVSEAYPLSKYGGIYNGWIIRLNSGGASSISFAQQPSAEAYTGFSNLSIDKWYHLAATYDGAAIRTYKNGALLDAQAFAGGYTPTASSLMLGRASWNNSGYFNGTIDEVRLYNRTLSDSEVMEHYTGGYGRFYSSAIKIVPTERYVLLNGTLARMKFVLWR